MRIEGLGCALALVVGAVGVLAGAGCASDGGRSHGADAAVMDAAVGSDTTRADTTPTGCRTEEDCEPGAGCPIQPFCVDRACVCEVACESDEDCVRTLFERQALPDETADCWRAGSACRAKTCHFSPAPLCSHEACDGGFDDDLDGFTDCADADCAMEEACRAGCFAQSIQRLTCGVLAPVAQVGEHFDDYAAACEIPREVAVRPDALLLFTPTRDVVTLFERAGDVVADMVLMPGSCGGAACLWWTASSWSPETPMVGLTPYYLALETADAPHDAPPPMGILPRCRVPEVCDDGVDNDLDGNTDCADLDCDGQRGSDAVPCERRERSCADGLDNDADGNTDCDDTDCHEDEDACPDGPGACDLSDVLDVGCDTGPITLDLASTARAGSRRTVACSRTEAVLRFRPPIATRFRVVGEPLLGDATRWRGARRYEARVVDGACTMADCYEDGPGTRLPNARGTYDVEANETLYILIENVGFDDGELVAELQCREPERCDSGVDEDMDGTTDCFDADCSDHVGCATETACGDGRDNDTDAAVDCYDPDCAEDPACQGEARCWDGEDDDADGLTDCGDPDCADSPVCPTVGTCDAPRVLETGDAEPVVLLAANQLRGSCRPDAPANPETVFEWEAPASGQYCVETQRPNHFYVRSRCDDAESEIACVPSDHQATIEATGGERYYIVAEPEYLASIDTLYRVTPGACVARPEERCNGLDDDWDSLTDEGVCREGDDEAGCVDGLDGDGDGATDCDDDDCHGDSRCWRCPEAPDASTSTADAPPLAADGGWSDVTLCPFMDQDWLWFDVAEGERVRIEERGARGYSCSRSVVDADGVEWGFGGDLSLPAGRYWASWALTWVDEPATGTMLQARVVRQERCDNGVDDDHDGQTDCADGACAELAACQAVEAARCRDGVDNDGNGDTDCADEACAARCEVDEVSCGDHFDNDGDGAVDCADPSCAAAPGCAREVACANDADDDGDGQIDCHDADCARTPTCGHPEVDAADDRAEGATVLTEATRGVVTDVDWYRLEVCAGGLAEVAVRFDAPGGGCPRFDVWAGPRFELITYWIWWPRTCWPDASGDWASHVTWHNSGSTAATMWVELKPGTPRPDDDLPLVYPYVITPRIWGCED